MKKFSMIFSLMLATMMIPVTVDAQTGYDDDVYVIEQNNPIPANETKKERKERIKKDKEIVDSIYHLKALKAISDGYFVLQATEVQNSRGRISLGLNDETNFLLMQGDKGIFQVAFNNFNPGLNGLGGVTLHGNITNFKMTEDKKGNAYITYLMIGRNMNAYVSITLYNGSDQAYATIDPTMSSGRLSLRGRLVPYVNENIRIDP